MNVFDTWIFQLLCAFESSRVTGPKREHDRVVYTGNFLSGAASDWYNLEVDGENRPVGGWRFDDLICALFVQFINVTTAQDAVVAYQNVHYDPKKGIRMFVKDMERYAVRMVEYPDDYSQCLKIMDEIPHEMVSYFIRVCGINAEYSTIDQMISAGQNFELSLKMERWDNKQKPDATPQTQHRSHEHHDNSGHSKKHQNHRAHHSQSRLIGIVQFKGQHASSSHRHQSDSQRAQLSNSVGN